jgi:hypothetical protein
MITKGDNMENNLEQAPTVKVKAEKTYTLIKTRKGSNREITGTLPELIKYFSYTLECGQSWNKKINRCPKTIAKLVSNVQASFEETEAACYERTLIELK